MYPECQLPPEQIEAFHRDGFLIVEEGLISQKALDLLEDGIRQVGVDQHRAIAVVPRQAQQPRLTTSMILDLAQEIGKAVA